MLVVLLLEALWLVLGDGRRAASVALPMLPGAFLLLALRGALTGAAWPWIALVLLLSFPAHLADLAARRRSWNADDASRR